MRLRLSAAAAVAAALAVLPTAASGARSPDQIRDAVGDVLAEQAYADIVSARWSSPGSGDDKALVVSMTLAAPPRTEAPFVYELEATVRGCGVIWFQYAPGSVIGMINHPADPTSDAAGASVWIECGDPSSPSGSSSLHRLSFTVKGNTLTWSVPLLMLPPQIQVGSFFSGFTAASDVGEPVLGTSPIWPAEVVDTAVGDGVWRIR